MTENKPEEEEQIPLGHYDYVIDKACLDCLLTSGDRNCEEDFLRGLNQVNLSMDDNSVFFYFSTGKPEKRIGLISRVFKESKIDIEEIGDFILFYF